MSDSLNSWAVHDAKARFSEFVEACLEQGPQLLTRRGAPSAVLVSLDEWKRLHAAAAPTLKALLLSEQGRTYELTPPRKARGQRKAARFD